MVAIGDSITAGGSATRREKSWVSILARLIAEHQHDEMGFFNAGMGGNVISSRCPNYDEATKPSGIERCFRDVVRKNPDLVIVAYGTNEICFNMPPQEYAEELDALVRTIASNTDSLVVLLGPYFIPTNADPDGRYNRGGIETACRYNEETKACAAANGALFADVFSAIGQAWWVVDTDNVHPNDLGHAAIACTVFETIALNCSCLSVQSYEAARTRPSWRDESHLKVYRDL